MGSDGITRVADLLSAGSTRREARASVAPLDRLAVGAYASTTGLSAEEHHLLRARALVGRVGGVVVSHATAAAAWQLPLRGRDLEVVHLSPDYQRRGNAKAGPGYHLHTQPIDQEDILVPDGVRATTPLRTVLDCARWMDRDWGVVIADAALHRSLIQPEPLVWTADRVRRLKGAERARALPVLASGLSESPGESLLRLRLLRMGLQPTEQCAMPWVDGQPRVDFLIDGRLVVEFDGEAKYVLHGDPARAHWLEKRRHDRLVEAGYEVIHVAWADLWDEATLRLRVNRALTSARHARRPLTLSANPPSGARTSATPGSS